MSRSYIAALCSTHDVELDGNGDCAACESRKPADPCACCRRPTRNLEALSVSEPWMCWDCCQRVEKVAAWLCAAVIAGPRVMPRRVVETTGTERTAA